MEFGALDASMLLPSTRIPPELPEQTARQGSPPNHSAHCRRPIHNGGLVQAHCPMGVPGPATISQHHRHPLSASIRQYSIDLNKQCRLHHPLSHRHQSWCFLGVCLVGEKVWVLIM